MIIRTTIEEAIARVEDWQGKEVTFDLVPGGITNPNYKVTVDGKPYFVKIPGAGTDFIDRDNCHIANLIASESGAGPKACYYFADTGVEIVEWIEGYRTLNFGDIFDDVILEKIAKSISNFHNIEGAKMPLVQSVFDQAWEMVDKAKEGNYLPPWHTKLIYLLQVTEEAFKNNGITLKPCHNDFWSNNVMYNDETGDLKIIDYEYASMNDPYYDLGLFATTNCLTEDMDVKFCEVYHGGEFDQMGFAKMKLYKLIGDIKWGYWCLAQRLNPSVDFDYMNWYCTKMARVQYMMLDPRVEIWQNMLNNVNSFYIK